MRAYCRYCRAVWVVPSVFGARCPTCKGKLVRDDDRKVTDVRECPEPDCGASMTLIERAPTGTMSLWRCVKCGKHLIVASGQVFQ